LGRYIDEHFTDEFFSIGNFVVPTNFIVIYYDISIRLTYQRSQIIYHLMKNIIKKIITKYKMGGQTKLMYKKYIPNFFYKS